MHELFRRFANQSARAMGTSWAFLFATLTVIVWAAAGPFYRYSDAWHLAINDWTNIATFLVVFLIQNTQNRDAKAMHLKLDELIKANKRARNLLIDLDALTDQEIQELESEYKRLCAQRSKAPGGQENAPLNATT